LHNLWLRHWHLCVGSRFLSLASLRVCILVLLRTSWLLLLLNLHLFTLLARLLCSLCLSPPIFRNSLGLRYSLC